MTSEDRLIKVGPADRRYYCSTLKYFDLKGHKEISQILISGANDGITSIQFQYVENGKYVLSDKYGYQGNVNEFHTIELNHPAEYITGVNGLYPGSDTGSDRIKAITFTTNVKEYGPFGVTNANLLKKITDPQVFTYNLAKSCQFGGFHGAYNNYGFLSIGFYFDAKTVPPNSASKIPKKEALIIQDL